jgi:hypothetical protein
MKKTISVQALKGIVKKPPFPVSIEDMNRAIAEAGAATYTSVKRGQQSKDITKSR